MCADAPVHHLNHTNDLRRVDRGRYALVNPAGRVTNPAPEPAPAVLIEQPLTIPDRAAGDSTVQRQAEVEAIRILTDRLSTPLTPERLKLTDGSVVNIDGVSHDPPILVEAWAHQGLPKPAQKHKVLADALKLTFAASTLGAQHHRVYRKVLCFCDEQAAAPFQSRSWHTAAFAHHGIELVTVELSDEWRQRIREAQERQRR